MKTSKAFWGMLVAVVLFLVTACGTNSSTTGSSGSTNGTVVPFSTFIQNVSQAQYSDYAPRSTTKVQNEQAFEEMRTHILKLYDGVKVGSTYMANGQTFDCIVPTGVAKSGPPQNVSAPSTSGTQQGQAGTSTQSSCKNGTIPMQRVTLEQLVQFPTLQAFLAKSPGGSSAPPIPPSNKK